MSSLLRTVQRAGDNLLLVEQFLASAGDSEGGPEATAPQAAGGAL
jgi:hypothetical protein